VKLEEVRDEITDLYFMQGWSYRAIGKKFGKSGEAIRQFLNREYPGRPSGKKFRKEVVAAQNKAREEERIKQLDSGQKCAVCPNIVYKHITEKMKEKHLTCSTECSRIWSSARYRLDPEIKERHRLSQAKSILKYPENHKDSEIKWAKKLLNGEQIADRKPRYRNDSKSSQFYERALEINNTPKLEEV